MNLNSLLDFIEIPSEIFNDKTGESILVMVQGISGRHSNVMPFDSASKTRSRLINQNNLSLVSIHELKDEDIFDILRAKMTNHGPLPIMFKESLINESGGYCLPQDFTYLGRTQKIVYTIEYIKKRIYNIPLSLLEDLYNDKNTKQKGINLCQNESIRIKLEKAILNNQEYKDQEHNLTVLFEEESSNLMAFYENYHELNKKIEESVRKIFQNQFTEGCRELSEVYFHCHSELTNKFYHIERE